MKLGRPLRVFFWFTNRVKVILKSSKLCDYHLPNDLQILCLQWIHQVSVTVKHFVVVKTTRKLHNEVHGYLCLQLLMIITITYGRPFSLSCFAQSLFRSLTTVIKFMKTSKPVLIQERATLMRNLIVNGLQILNICRKCLM